MRKISLALLVLLGGMARAQANPPDPVKPPAWPALGKAGEQKLALTFKELRDSQDEGPRQKAEDALAELGPAVAPFLLDRLSDGARNQNLLLTRVLDRVTAAEHAPLLARRAQDPKAALRGYVLRRLTRLQQKDLAPLFRKARKDRDPEIAFQAALGLLSAGDIEALDAVFDRALTEWIELRERLTEALPGARGTAASQHVLARMQGANEQTQTTGLRLLRFLAAKDAAAAIKPYLDSEVHNVKKEAINTLRVVLDGQEPLEQLSVFDAIEMAKQWKER